MADVLDGVAVDDVDVTEETQVDVAAEAVDEGVDESEAEASADESGDKSATPVPTTGKAIRDAVRALSEEHPEQAKLLKELADEHFKMESTYKKMFPTPEAASEAKELIEAVGGVDGVRGLQERIEAYDAQDNMLNIGDPKVLDEIFTQFPQGAAALAPAYLEKLAATDGQAFTNAVAPYVINMLHTAGVFNHLAGLLEEKDPERLTQGIQKLAEYFNGQINGVKSLRAKAAANQGNAGNSAIEKERAALTAEKNQIFIDRVQSAAVAKITPTANATIAQQTKNFKLSETQVAHYKETLDKKIFDALNANKTYQNQLKIRISAKGVTPESLADYQAGEYNRVMKEIAFDVAKGIFGSPKGAAGQVKKPGAKPVIEAQVQGKPILVSAQPADNNIDWNRPDAENNFIHNVAYLKNGRFVTWR
jgi:hypothetical protein